MLARLEDAIGRERFAVFLQSYMKESTSTTPQLFRQLEEVAGEDARERFEETLAN